MTRALDCVRRSDTGKSHVGIRRDILTSSAVVRQLFVLLDASGRSYGSVADLAGIHSVTMTGWKRKGKSPRLSDFENAAEALGYRLVLRPLSDPSSDDDGQI